MAFTSKLAKLKKDIKINRFMILPKAAYFFHISFYGALFEFNTTFLKDIGLTPKQAGYINGLRSIPTIIGSLIFSTVADRTKKHRIIVPVLAILSALILVSIPWVAATLKSQLCLHFHKNNTFNRNTTSFLGVKHRNVTNSENQISHGPRDQFITGEVENAAIDKGKHNDSECHHADNAVLYQTMLAMNLLAGFLNGPFLSFSDSIVSTYVQLSPVKTSMSTQIRFIYLGWASGSAVVGVLADFLPINGVSPYTWCFILSGVCLCIYGSIMFRLYSQVNEHRSQQEHRHLHSSSNVSRKDNEDSSKITQMKHNQMTNAQAMLHILTCPHVWLYLFTLLIISAGLGAFGGFLFIFLESIGASSLNLGLTTFATRIADLIACSLVDRAIRYVGGELQTMALSCMLCAIRSVMVSFLHDPWFVLLYLATTPFTPFFRTSSVQIISKIAPKHLNTVMFSLHDCIYTSGLVVGNMIGGVAYERYHGRGLFRMASIILAGWSALLLVYRLIIRSDKLKQIGDEVNGYAQHKESNQKKKGSLSQEETEESLSIL